LIYKQWPSAEIDLRIQQSENLLKSITQIENPSVSKLLRFYKATCYYKLGKIREANELVSQILKDNSLRHFQEATLLRFKIEAQDAFNNATPEQRFIFNWRKKQQSLATSYPKSWYADKELRCRPRNSIIEIDNGPELRLHSLHNRYFPKQNISHIYNAGLLYYEMNSFENSIDTYQLAIDMSADHFNMRITRPKKPLSCDHPYVDLWACMGNSYAQLGELEKALSCYLNSVASGNLTSRLQLKIKMIINALQENKVTQITLPNPNNEKLETIAQLFLETDLFDEAVSATESAAKVAGKPNAALFSRIYSKKADILERCFQDYETGSIFRGTPITQENIDLARQQAKKWAEYEHVNNP